MIFFSNSFKIKQFESSYIPQIYIVCIFGIFNQTDAILHLTPVLTKKKERHNIKSLSNTEILHVFRL